MLNHVILYKINKMWKNPYCLIKSSNFSFFCLTFLFSVQEPEELVLSMYVVLRLKAVNAPHMRECVIVCFSLQQFMPFKLKLPVMLCKCIPAVRIH